MATINIVRRKEYNDRGRSYTIMLDGKYAGTIASGQSVNINTSPGLHTVSLKIDWCSSPDIVLNIKEDKIDTLLPEDSKMQIGLCPLQLYFWQFILCLKFFSIFNISFI